MRLANLFYYGGAVAISSGLLFGVNLFYSVIASPSAYGEFAFFLNLIIVSSTFVGYVGHAAISNNYFAIDENKRSELLLKSIAFLAINVMIFASIIGAFKLLSGKDVEQYIIALAGGTGLFLFRLVSVQVQMHLKPRQLFEVSLIFFLVFLTALLPLTFSLDNNKLSLVTSFLVASSAAFGFWYQLLSENLLFSFAFLNEVPRLLNEYRLHLKRFFFIYCDACLAVLFPFVDKVVVRSVFEPEKLGEYYFVFTISMVYLLFSELLMKRLMPELMREYTQVFSSTSGQRLNILRIRYTIAMALILVFFFFLYALFISMQDTYEATWEYFWIIFCAQFFLTQIKFDNVWLVARGKGRSLLIASTISILAYLAAMKYFIIDSLLTLATIYFFAVFLWWGALVVFKFFYIKKGAV